MYLAIVPIDTFVADWIDMFVSDNVNSSYAAILAAFIIYSIIYCRSYPVAVWLSSV